MKEFHGRKGIIRKSENVTSCKGKSSGRSLWTAQNRIRETEGWRGSPLTARVRTNQYRSVCRGRNDSSFCEFLGSHEVHGGSTETTAIGMERALLTFLFLLCAHSGFECSTTRRPNVFTVTTSRTETAATAVSLRTLVPSRSSGLIPVSTPATKPATTLRPISTSLSKPTSTFTSTPVTTAINRVATRTENTYVEEWPAGVSDGVDLPPRREDEEDAEATLGAAAGRRGRAATLRGAAAAHPLPKCCPRGERLDARLQGCERAEGAAAGAALPLGDGGAQGERPPCARARTLRLDAAAAAARVRLQGGRALLAVRAPGSNASVEVALERGEFCADGAAQPAGPFALLLCPCARAVCVPKCCAEGQALAVEEASVVQVHARCVELAGAEQWTPRFQADAQGRSSVKAFAVLEGAWPAGCAHGFTRAPPSWTKAQPSDFFIMPSGNVSINTNPPMLVSEFCVDREIRSRTALVQSVVVCAVPWPLLAVDLCFSLLLVLGLLALAAALAVHALLPELRASPFGRALMAYVAALLLANLVGIAWTLAPNVSRFRCVFTIMWRLYFILAANLWMNVMCLDMALAFRSFQRMEWRGGRFATRRFAQYSAYAWAAPLLSLVPMLGLQLSQPAGSPWRPVEWYMKCQYFTWASQFVFLYTPMLILLLANLCLFALILWRMRMLTKDSKVLQEEGEDSCEASPYSGRKTLLLYVKILWAVGMLETALEIAVGAGASQLALWYAGQVVDASRCFCVFVLFCCKPRVWRRVRERLCRSSRVAPAPDTTLTQSSRVSDGAAPAPGPAPARANVVKEAAAAQASVVLAAAARASAEHMAAAEEGAARAALSESEAEWAACAGAPSDCDAPLQIEMRVISTTSL